MLDWSRDEPWALGTFTTSIQKASRSCAHIWTAFGNRLWTNSNGALKRQRRKDNEYDTNEYGEQGWIRERRGCDQKDNPRGCQSGPRFSNLHRGPPELVAHTDAPYREG